jgi:hypothetical protein
MLQARATMSLVTFNRPQQRSLQLKYYLLALYKKALKLSVHYKKTALLESLSKIIKFSSLYDVAKFRDEKDPK